MFNEKTTTSKELWKNLGNLINHKNKSKLTKIEKVVYQGKSYSNDKEIADIMNNHFCTIGESLREKLPNSNDNDFKSFLPPPILNSFSLSHIIAEEIMVEIHKLNPQKAAGHDSIGPRILKLCPEIFALNLEIIFNKYIDEGVYPSEMKIARVIALLKKGQHI